MRRYTLYAMDVTLLRSDGKKENHVLYIGAPDITRGFEKAARRLRQSPHGISVRKWHLTGKYDIIGYVFV